MNTSPNRNHSVKLGRSSLMGSMGKIFKLVFFKERMETGIRDETEEVRQLVEDINDARREWTNANINFEYADSQEMVDYYTYRIKAYEVMYQYLIKKAKEKGIKNKE